MKIISVIYKGVVIKIEASVRDFEILIQLNVYEERKNLRAPPQVIKENTQPVVKIVPCDDGWPEYEEPVFDFYKFKNRNDIRTLKLNMNLPNMT